MTLDEAIKHAEEVAEENEKKCTDGQLWDVNESRRKCAKEHRQLAEWLRDYKRLLEKEPVLDKIRAEIEEKYGDYDICEWFNNYDYEENDISEYQLVGKVSDILKIIDRYKVESEE